MRHLILIFGMAFLIACSSQKKVQSDFSENVRLTNTTATTSSSQSLLDMVASWSGDFDSLDICVEPLDSCRSSAAVTAAQPSRLHLRARHASIANKTAINKSVRTDSVVIDTLAVHRTTQREDKTNSESSAVYKPPDGSIVLIIIAMAFIFFFFIKQRR